MSRHDPLGFDVISAAHGDDGAIRAFAWFVCSKCAATFQSSVKPGTRLNPEMIAKRACAAGWQAWPYRASRTYCPNCQAKEAKALPDNIHKLPPPEKAEARKPSADERMKIRGALDGHFDDAKGIYLDNYSDALVAERLNMPRIWVEQIREAAYGPILVSPEMAALRQDIEGVRKSLEEGTKRAQALYESYQTIKKAIDDLAARAAKLGAT